MKAKKLINSFKYAFMGIFSSMKTERNLKIHLTIMILVILSGLIFNISILEWILCIVCFGIVISGELFNTAIETVVDMVSPEYNEKAKLAKDISAGGVLVLAIASAIIGFIIFLPKFFMLF